MMKADTEKQLKALRRKIDALDDQILELLTERAQTAREVGHVKGQSRVDVYNPLREAEILNRLASKNPGPFPGRAIAAVFREIISACRSLEEELTVFYFGPPATYTHLACIERFGSSIQAVPKESIQEVFEGVERGKARFGVVPIENSTEGAVDRTLDMLIASEVQICGEVLLRISHDLLSRNGKREDVRRIHSHPQALGQCREWLRKNFPQSELAETGSTSKAAQMAAEDPESAAVASSFAAQFYGLQVIDSQIEDYAHNYTRFLVLGGQGRPRSGKDKTSILFSVADSPGSLYEVLKPFAARGINLTKIESRPIKDRPWNYVFFVDCEGHCTDRPIEEVMGELKKTVLFAKLLGSYPKSS